MRSPTSKRTLIASAMLGLAMFTACEHSPSAPGVVASIVVTSDAATLPIGGTRQLTATGRDANGSVVDIDPTWSVAASGGTVSPTGLFTAGTALGTFANTVVASVGSISGSASITVVAGPVATIVVTPTPVTLAAGTSQPFAAVVRDAGGNVLPVTPSWSLTAGGGTLTSAGLFTAGQVAGTFTNTVRANVGAVLGSATVTVTVPGPAPTGQPLGAAATHGILAGSGITCASAPGTVNADASVWPGSAISGFPPCTITGARHAADAFAQAAQGDLTTAFLQVADMPCGTTITADLGGTTLAPGVYCSTSSVGVTGVVTLAGPSDAVFVIRAPSTLTTAGSVVLSGGAQARNVIWWVGSSATLGTGSQWQGNILAFTSITFVDNVTLIGRALARNGSVSLGTNTVITLP